MKFITLVFIFAINFAYSQSKNYRFIYDYKYAQDSTKIDSTFTELMYLDISEEGSIFYSRNVFVGDSLMNQAVRGQTGNISVKLDNTKGKQRDIIRKLYPSFTIVVNTNIAFDNYTYEDPKKMIWDISSDVSVY